MDEDSVELARQVAGVDAVEGQSTTSANIIQEGKDDVFIQFTAIENTHSLTVNTLKPTWGESSIPSLGDGKC